MYNTKDGGNYPKAAFIFFGITDKKLILTFALQLSKHIKEVLPLNSCSTFEQLLEEESVSQFLLKLLTTMRKKNYGHKEL